MIGKLRTSSHNLQVEMGRRTGTSRERRLCTCGLNVEDEKHFLTECLLYDDIRRKYDIRGLSVSNILNNETYTDYIHELYEKRKMF